MLNSKRRMSIFPFALISVITLLLSQSAASVPLESALFAHHLKSELLQFTQGGHVLAFTPTSVYAASGDHVLKVEFSGANGVTPAIDNKQTVAEHEASMRRVVYNELWQGINLTYEPTEEGIVESTWQIAPGSNPDQICLRYNSPVAIQENGELWIGFSTGWMQESPPIAWQDIDGKRHPVQVAFRKIDENEIGFDTGDYDPSYPLLIDPTMQWNTFIGGALWTNGYSLILDDSGNIYVAGRSQSTWGVPLNAHSGYNNLDGFVAKFNGSGILQWNTFMGSPGSSTTGIDMTLSLAVDKNGNVYATGYSQLSWGTPQNGHSGAYDAFVTKLAPNGARLWNTFLGSTDNDYPYVIAVDPSGDLLVGGRSDASWGTPLNSYTGTGGTLGHEAFVARLNSVNGALQWNTFLGGTGTDLVIDMAGDGNGNYILAGYSNSSWGTPVNAHGGDMDAFAAKLSGSGVLQWNTFLGGTGIDYGQGVAVDGAGNIFVGGFSNLTWGTALNPHAGGDDVFVAKLDATGAQLWHTFMGTAGSDIGGHLVLNSSGNVAVTGTSDASWGSAPVRAYSGNKDGFAALLDTDGTLLWNGFLGGANANPAYHDFGVDIGVDCTGNVYVIGSSESPGWGSPIRPFTGTATNTFVARLGEPGHAVCTRAPVGEGSFNPISQLVANGQTTSFDITALPGFDVNAVTGCGGAWNGANPYLTGTITGNCLLEATFTTLASYSVNATVDANGTLNQTSQSVYAGAGASFTVTSNPGFAPNTSVGGDCPAGTWNGTTYTTGPISADCTVQFSHSVAHEVEAVVDVHGSLDKSSATVAEGSSASFTITSNPGYVVDTTVGGDCPVGTWNGATYTTGPISVACTLSFTHSPMSYLVSATIDPNGTLDASSRTVAHGTAASFTISPDTSYLPDTTVGGDCPAGSWNGATYTTGTIVGTCSVNFATIYTTYTVTPSPGPPASSIDSGEFHSVALTSGGTVAAWGLGFNPGQTPLPVGLTNVKAVAAGFNFNLAINGDDTVAAWGSPIQNTFGETTVPQGLSNVKGIAGGWHHALAVKNDGSIVAWGAGTTNTGSWPEYGQAMVPPGIGFVAEVSAGAYHSLALKTDRTVTAWGGLNQYGETTVPQGLTNVRAISAGGNHNLALKLDGTVVAWGAGDKSYISSPHFGQSNVPAGLNNVIAVTAGFYHSLALKTDGTVVAWGAGTTNTGLNPEYGQSIVPPDLTNVVAIAAGRRHSLALKSDGSIVVWGENNPGSQGTVPAALQILPNGTITPNVPQQVPLGTAAQFTVSPQTGYTASVGGSCGGTLAASTYTTDLISTDCTVVASFGLSGDIDGNEVLDLTDAIVALQIMAGGQQPITPGPGADINGDGRIGVAEVVHVLRMIGGI